MAAGEETCEFCHRTIGREEQAFVLNGEIACEQCNEKLRGTDPTVTKQARTGESPHETASTKYTARYWLAGAGLCSICVLLLLMALFLRGRCEGPYVRSLVFNKEVVLKKGEYKLGVTLRECRKAESVPIGGINPMDGLPNRVLMISVRNLGCTRWDGRCETFLSMSKGSILYAHLIAFTPEGTDPVAVRETENEKGRVVFRLAVLPLALEPNRNREFITGCHLGETDAAQDKFIGHLYPRLELDSNRRSGLAGDSRRDSVLHERPSLGEADVAVEALKTGTNVNAADKDGKTPLHVAASEGKVDVANALISRGAGINLQTKYGMTPLHMAATFGHYKVVQLLLNKKADISLTNTRGATALHQACAFGFSDIAGLLLDRGAKIDCRDNNGRNPLHDAADGGKIPVIDLLLSRGAQVNAQDKEGNTALHLASYSRYHRAAEALLKWGADSRSKNAAQQTPSEYAATRGEVEITKLLNRNIPERPTSRGETLQAKFDAVYSLVKDDELSLGRGGEAAFYSGQYEQVIRFLGQARRIQDSKVWQTSYPYLAGAYWLTGQKATARAALEEMKVEAGRSTGFLTTSLERMRENIERVLHVAPPEDREFWTRVLEDASPGSTPGSASPAGRTNPKRTIPIKPGDTKTFTRQNGQQLSLELVDRGFDHELRSLPEFQGRLFEIKISNKSDALLRISFEGALYIAQDGTAGIAFGIRHFDVFKECGEHGPEAAGVLEKGKGVILADCKAPFEIAPKESATILHPTSVTGSSPVTFRDFTVTCE